MSRKTKNPITTISIGGGCPNRCSFCSSWSRKPMAMDELISAVSVAVGEGARQLYFDRGELTFHPQLSKVLRFLAGLDLPWSMATNGRLFSLEKNVSLFQQAGLVLAEVSLHGPREVHDDVTGVASFDQTCQGIRNLVAGRVPVRISIALTPELLACEDMEPFAAVIASLGVQELHLVPVPALQERNPMRMPLRSVADWLDRFRAKLPGNDIRLAGIPLCVPGKEFGAIASKTDRSPLWPCQTCSRLGDCPGFNPAHWEIGDEDWLIPESASAPGHLTYRRTGRIKAFDVAHCPIKSHSLKIPVSSRGAMMAGGDFFQTYRLENRNSLDSVVLHARLVHRESYHCDADRRCTALELHTSCVSCPRAHECPGVLQRVEAGDGEAQADVPENSPAPRALHRMDELVQLASTEDVELSEPVREIWLLEKKAIMPRRPFPVDPPVLLEALRRRGVVPIRLPVMRRTPDGALRTTVAGKFRVVVAAKERIESPFLRMNHMGVSMQVTESCMCRCVMCNGVGHFKIPFVPLSEVLSRLEQFALAGYRRMDFFGGEVTLRRDLFDLVRHAVWFGMESMFITTGYYLSPSYVKRLVEAGLDRIVVSIDGSRPEIHDGIRQLPGLWKKAVRALRVMSREKRLEAFSSTVILTENLEDLPDLIRLSGRLGIRQHVFFLPVSGTLLSTIPRWPTPLQTDELFDRIIPLMEAEAEAAGVSIDFRPEFRSWPVDNSTARNLISSGTYNFHSTVGQICRAPGRNLFVTVDGAVYPCDMPSIFGKDQVLGNLKETDLFAILSSPRLEDFSHSAGHFAGCRMCSGRYEAME